MVKPKVIILGAGGHARVLLCALRSSGTSVEACLDPDVRLHGTRLDGTLISGGEGLLDGEPPENILLFNGVGAPKDCRARRAVYERFSSKGYRFPAVLAASALTFNDARWADGVQVLTRAVVHPGSSVGENTIINTGAIIEHDCSVGAHCHVAPGAVVCGGVTIGSGSLVGAGAVVLPGVRIGDGARVAAGAVVRRDCPPGRVVLPLRTRSRSDHQAGPRR